MTNRRFKTTSIAFAWFLLLASSSVLYGQSAWGYTDVSYNPAYDWIDAHAVTYPDYSTQYYYDPRVSLVLSGTDGFYDSIYCYYASYCSAGDMAWLGLVAAPTPGASYSSTAYHELEVYYYYWEQDPGCTYGCWDWYDAFGYSFDECSPSCKADPNCFCVDAWGTPPSWYWYPPLIPVLVYAGSQDLGQSNDTVENPVPALQVRYNGSPIPQGSTTFITAGSSSSPPQMPALTAQLTGTGLISSTSWRMSVEYNGHGRADSDSFPVSSTRTLPSVSIWDIRSDTGEHNRGGTATIRYRYSDHPERTFSFQIRGTNPTEANVKGKIGNSPWFLTRLVRQESAYRQFNGSDPLFGPPNGWGMMQIDPPPGPQEIWNWWWNTDVGKSRLAGKQTELNTTWSSRVSEWNLWNQQNPSKAVGPPADRQEGSQCSFTWNSGSYGSEQTKSFKDACWIKRYNGADNGDYLIWENRPPFEDNPRWSFRPANSSGHNYTAAICDQVP